MIRRIGPTAARDIDNIAVPFATIWLSVSWSEAVVASHFPPCVCSSSTGLESGDGLRGGPHVQEHVGHEPALERGGPPMRTAGALVQDHVSRLHHHMGGLHAVPHDLEGPGLVQVLGHVDDGGDDVRVRPVHVVLQYGAFSVDADAIDGGGQLGRHPRPLLEGGPDHLEHGALRRPNLRELHQLEPAGIVVDVNIVGRPVFVAGGAVVLFPKVLEHGVQHGRRPSLLESVLGEDGRRLLLRNDIALQAVPVSLACLGSIVIYVQVRKW
mmetsp:Transcript_1559/g.4607  ORF Transcript_1559/g.4607 Transcript_1559/m.4607 type:complete len:268 (-) Transcript_1559:436-1239(-)